MLILRSSPASPFGRKVKLTAAVLGLLDRIETQDANTQDPNDTLRQQNPLGKIPVLITEAGETLFDSRVAVEYLDHLSGGNGVIPTDESRFHVLTTQALADGIMDAAILQVYEGRYRPEEIHHQPWLDRQQEKITRAMTFLEGNLPKLNERPDIGTIAVACALGYLDLRFAGAWRKDYPKLVSWLDTFAAQVPAFEKTRVTA